MLTNEVGFLTKDWGYLQAVKSNLTGYITSEHDHDRTFRFVVLALVESIIASL